MVDIQTLGLIIYSTSSSIQKFKKNLDAELFQLFRYLYFLFP